MKSCKSHEKNDTKIIRSLVFSFSLIIDLAFWCFLFCFFMWFARFQILICEPQSIWRKLLVPSWLYLSSLNEVSLVIFLTGKLSASVRYSRHSSNFPWQILRLIPMPRWNTLRHLGAFGSTWTSWKTSRFQDKRVFEVSSPSVSSSSFLKWYIFLVMNSSNSFHQSRITNKRILLTNIC